jgi:hypothetical protein
VILIGEFFYVILIESFCCNQWLKMISWNLSDKEEYNGTIDYLLERNGKK